MAHVGLHSAIIKSQAELPRSTEGDRRIFKERGWGRLHRRGGFGETGLLQAEEKQDIRRPARSTRCGFHVMCDPMLLGCELLWRRVCLGVLKSFYRLWLTTRPTHGRSSEIGY